MPDQSPRFERLPQDADGWRVMDEGLAQARHVFGDRLVAAFAIGSLAHGGFAPAASDVDLALILADLDGQEKNLVSELNGVVRRGNSSPLAGRLSVFWSTWSDLEAGRSVGRLPLADLQDFVEAGVCLTGDDQRQTITLPSAQELHQRLICEGASFMLEKLATPERDARLRDPRLLIELGCREVTKAVLFPARFLFSAQAGRTAGNDEAVQFIAETATGPERELVLDAFRWRVEGTLGAKTDTLSTLEAGLLPLYDRLLGVYETKLDGLDEPATAAAVADWRRRLTGKPERAKVS